MEGSTSDLVGAKITKEEVAKIGANLPLGKAAGPDRIPNGFWKAFSKKVAPLLAAAYNEAQSTGKCIKGFKDGIVAILYKKGSRTEIRNYRPITLLNGDYKLLTRILAKRMLNIVSQFVSKAQIGFMPRTFIAEATTLLKLVQAHLDAIDEGGLAVAFDFEKAFDKCSWSYLKKAIKALKFT